MYLAHVNENAQQSVKEHLENVAKLSGSFAEDFGYQDYAYLMGLAHDLGKYSDKFQKKITGHPEISVDHSTAGAKELFHTRNAFGAMGIAGHHGGLPNGISMEESCLLKRVKERKIENYEGYLKEIVLPIQKEPILKGYEGSFLTRMLFSCLVDADFLDTEAFMQNGRVERGGFDDIDTLFNRLLTHISGWLKKDQDRNTINYWRTEILKRCLEVGTESEGLFSLTVPTGAGKTISSLAFALQNAKKFGKKRIIYVIPYTSIIEQNAKIFRDILGDVNVIEHHANALLDADENDSKAQLQALSTENWDAPVIVTTNVQFFESLYANQVSKCRKLHNIANSVIIFDEAQMLPLNYFKPCIRAVKELVEHYRVTAVMCTATQPALDRWFSPLPMKEICVPNVEMFPVFHRTIIESGGLLSKEQLADQMKQENQILTIVNKKADAQSIYESIKSQNAFHLSTFMTPMHRKRTLARIRDCLRDGKECRVVSTSLVEAGVDLDFPCLLREEAGLDSIIQAAGRCNREGKRNAEDCRVKVFRLEGRPFRMLEKNIFMMKESIEKFHDYASMEAVQYYFQQIQDLDESYLDQKRIIEGFEKDYDGIKMPFAEIAKVFHLIEQDTHMLIIPVEPEAISLLKELQDKREYGISAKKTLRKLGRYSINIYSSLYNRMLLDGSIYECMNGIAVLQNLTFYDEQIGLCYQESEGAEGFFF